MQLWYIRPLVQGAWPLLEPLCLYNVVDDTLGVDKLLHNCWPLLKMAHLAMTSHDHDLAC